MLNWSGTQNALNVCAVKWVAVWWIRGKGKAICNSQLYQKSLWRPEGLWRSNGIWKLIPDRSQEEVAWPWGMVRRRGPPLSSDPRSMMVQMAIPTSRVGKPWSSLALGLCKHWISEVKVLLWQPGSQNFILQMKKTKQVPMRNKPV